MPGTVYAGSPNGVYVSTSGGGGWTVMNDGLEYPAITGLAVSSDHYLYASTYGAGMDRWHINTGIEEQTISPGSAFLNAFPNPACGRVTFTIGQSAMKLGGADNAELRIYDSNGRLVGSFPIPNALSPIPTAITWNGTDEIGDAVPAGVYFCRLSLGGSKIVKTLILIK